MCPEFTGERLHDHAQSATLIKEAFEYCSKVLKSDGNFLFKAFDGRLLEEIIVKQ